MKPIRVVQITDLHILPEAEARLVGVDTAQSLSKVIDDIGQLSPPADLIIASGDLTDDGSPQAYRRLRKLFSDIDYPIFVIAGNHDETANMNEYLVAGNIFHQKQQMIGGWQILYLNSKVEGYSYGQIADEEMRWLKSALDTNNSPTLLVMHHTPLRLCASPSCQMENNQALLSLLVEYDFVKGLIAGHTHNHVEEHQAQCLVMTTPSTMIQVTHSQTDGFKTNSEFWDNHQADNSRHGYRLLDMHADGSLISEVRWVTSV